MSTRSSYFYRVSLFVILLALNFSITLAQKSDDAANCKQVNTYTNPVLPGDHPDPTLLKVGNDFYHCGSSFHFNPYMPIYHSTDLVHWEVVGRVLPPAKAVWVSDRPSNGTWQGAITYFYGSYWIYFSAGGQWFCKADSPCGPWSDPVEVKTNPVTGPLGYDNSIFIDDDGTPYMVIKNGQFINRIQALGKDGQLAGKVINLDWINAKLQYSWAEGPVMCKRNGFYFYFPAGDVSGGQFVLRTRELTADSTKWERLGNFFQPVSDFAVGCRRPNHISAPLQLADGTWWTIGHSYEKYDGDDWAGTGRQTSLYPVIWEGDRPWGLAPTSQPIRKPELCGSGIHWRSVCSDDFENNTLNSCWHYLTKKVAGQYSLTDRLGWLRLRSDSSRAHILQKETDHYYTALTKVDFNATNVSDKAGIYLTNGNQQVTVQLYSGYDGQKKIILKMDNEVRSIPNTIGDEVWLKLERYGHDLTAFCSADGRSWVSLGASVSAANLDKEQPNFNSWVGTSIGLFAEGKSADFDKFVCKDGFSDLPAVGFSNYYAVKAIKDGNDKLVTNTSPNGGWFMISGVDLGKSTAKYVNIKLTSTTKSYVEIWADDLKDGKLIAKIPVSPTGQNTKLKLISQKVQNLSGQHDIFVKFLPGNAGSVKIENVRFCQ